MSASPSVAVIDIGSNSIKVLVAARAPDGSVAALKFTSLDVRISAGISLTLPRLSDEGMANGLAAIQQLLAEAAPFAPVATVLVATSAVRDARNGPEFRSRVKAATGHEIRILTGEEEANLIGRGLTCDPALLTLRNFYVFDLGGGSLECLAFEDRQIRQAVSLPLGCVRLTEMFVKDPTGPFTSADYQAMYRHSQTVMRESGFRFNIPDVAAIATGGTMTTVRTILALRAGTTLDLSPSIVDLDEMFALFEQVAPLSLAARCEIPGLPAARADVFPAALATLLSIAQRAKSFSAFHHSLYNLRFGLAADELAKLG